MTRKNIFFFIVIVSIALFALWSTYILYEPKLKKMRVRANLPDAFMEEVDALIMDKEGQPHLKIKAPHMIHFAQNNTSNLINPEILLYRDSKEPWHITAKIARAQQGADIINFWQHVVIHHPPDDASPDTVIKTAELNVQTKDQFADTNLFITLTQPNLTLEAIGMHADMKNGSIKLMSHARGKYVPS